MKKVKQPQKPWMPLKPRDVFDVPPEVRVIKHISSDSSVGAIYDELVRLELNPHDAYLKHDQGGDGDSSWDCDMKYVVEISQGTKENQNYEKEMLAYKEKRVKYNADMLIYKEQQKKYEEYEKQRLKEFYEKCLKLLNDS